MENSNRSQDAVAAQAAFEVSHIDESLAAKDKVLDVDIVPEEHPADDDNDGDDDDDGVTGKEDLISESELFLKSLVTWKFWKNELFKSLPPLTWVPVYAKKPRFWFADLVSGVTVGVMALPQALAYAAVANVSAVSGLYTAIIPPVVYFLFASSSALIVGPTAILSLIVGNAISRSCNLKDTQCVQGLANFMAIVSGSAALLLGILHAGRVFQVIASPVVLDSFTVAAGMVIFVSQLATLMGITKTIPSNTFIQIVGDVFSNLDLVNVYALYVGLACIGFLLTLKIIKRFVKPLAMICNLGNFFVVVLCIALYTPLDLSSHKVKVVGAVPNLPAPQFHSLQSSAGDAIASTLVVLLIGIMESLAIASTMRRRQTRKLIEQDAIDRRREADETELLNVQIQEESNKIAKSQSQSIADGDSKSSEPAHDEQLNAKRSVAEETLEVPKLKPTQEMKALGLGNFVGSFFYGFPATGSFSRTAVNVDAGAKSPVSNLLGAITVLVIVLIFGNLLKYLPKTTLSAIVMVAAVNLIRFEELQFAWRNSDPLKIEVLIWGITFICSLVFRIEIGLGVGICCNILYNLLKTSFPRFTQSIKYQVIVDQTGNAKKQPQRSEEVLVLTWTGPLIYTNCENLRRLLEKEAERRHALKEIEMPQAPLSFVERIPVELNASAISDIDSAAIHVLNALSTDFDLRFINPSTRITRALRKTKVTIIE
eukprot:TRINITY_DN80480_c0_g1_i1.p1 TRINITY_DN80480_c0_g1~~TRINITY_DN80480_c0_g1_i1.p1  ORF type:complete len:711 (+),score=185.79 TRINITY_DN80480_c0_g1_i1:323-2455(+)